MTTIPPLVRYFVACENAFLSQHSPQENVLVNVLGTIRSPGDPPFPFVLSKLCFFVQLINCRGGGELGLDIIHDESGETVLPKRQWAVQFSNQPLTLFGMVLRVRGVEFTREGMCLARLWFNDLQIGERALQVRSSHES